MSSNDGDGGHAGHAGCEWFSMQDVGLENVGHPIATHSEAIWDW